MADVFAFPKTDSAQPTTSDTRPPDWEARDHALDIHQSWIVEAPAGSGKTGLLIQRYLKLLADESVEQPEQVLAITFTVKATTEMRDRVLSQLERAAGPDLTKSEFDRATRALAQAVLHRDALFGWKLMDNPRRLRIRTIDSVCGEIARSLPVLSGGGGGQSPVKDATLLYREAARQTLMQLGGPDPALNEALRTVLLHRDGNLKDCERLLADVLAMRDQWGSLIPLKDIELDDIYLDGTVLPKLQRALEQAVCAGLTELANSFPPGILDELTALTEEIAHADGYNGKPLPIALCARLHSTPGETAEHLEHWKALIHLLTTKKRTWRRTTATSKQLGFEIEKNHAVRLKLLTQQLHDQNNLLRVIKRVASLPPARYPQEQWAVAKSLFLVLRRAMAELQLVFSERGECDFVELGLLARTALQQNGAVDDLAAALGMQLQHLLVDEMQDTSTSQYELIELLTQGWDGHSQTVFLVGDPKQSIYLFRQARVERFVQTMMTGQFGELPVGCLRLTANFRSQGGLVNAFNQDFPLLFSGEAATTNPEDVPYVEAIPVRSSTQDRALSAVWHGGVLPHAPSPDDARDARQRQTKLNALEIRGIIEQWQTRPLPEDRIEPRRPWKIAILVRSRSHLIDIVAELKKNTGSGPIPFRAVDIEPLGERQEILDLFALTRALVHPADRVAWLALLHAPWCGLGLAELHMLAGADDPDWAERSMEDVIAERGHLLSEESCERLRRLWPVLRAAANQRSRLSTAQWVERTWRSLGGDAYQQPAEMANVRRYLQLLDEIESQTGALDFNLLTRRLEKLFAQADVIPGAVDLITIHGAKGLEWDVVIVPALEKKAPSNSGRLLTWSEINSEDKTAAHVILAPIAGKGEGSKALNSWLNGIYNAREAAERKRLFYVACTRAREELHLFAAPEAKADGEVNLPHGSLLKTAWPAAQSHYFPAVALPNAPAKTLVIPSTNFIEDEYIGDLAAATKETAQPPTLQRLPLKFDPGARIDATKKLPYGDTTDKQEATHFERPEGSLEARAIGNTVHAFLEILAKRFDRGASADELLREVAGWGARIAAVLRGDGLPPALLTNRTLRVQAALSNTLQDAEGLWVLGAQDEASSEYALTSWTEQRTSVRLDRVFRAGIAPLITGRESIWIVDYKTTTHGEKDIEKFLEGERAKYEPQMETYARIIKASAEPGGIRVGLYYPMLPKLIWWTPTLV